MCDKKQNGGHTFHQLDKIGSEMTANMDRLANAGFKAAGNWLLAAHGLELDLQAAMAGERDVLYAFAVDGTLAYVGKTALSLRERMQRYKTPARSGERGGSTNIKNHRNIIAALQSGQAVEIFILRNQGQPQRHGEFLVSLSAGLEDNLIRELSPPWNGRPSAAAPPVAPLPTNSPVTIKHAHHARTEPRLSKVDFQRAIRGLLTEATCSGLTQIEIRSGTLHTKVGGYPGPGHSMPTCCNVMYAEMKPGDDVREAPPKGRGANLVINYRLPRN